MSGVGRLPCARGCLAGRGGRVLRREQLGDDEAATGTVVATADFFGGHVTVDDAVAAPPHSGRCTRATRRWPLGVTGDRWAVIRRPGQPLQPVWLPLAMVSHGADAGPYLPDLSCAAAADVAAATTVPTATTPTTATAPGAVTTIGPGHHHQLVHVDHQLHHHDAARPTSPRPPSPSPLIVRTSTR